MDNIKCPNCGYEGEPKYGRNFAVEVGLFLIGFITFGIGWIGLMFYYGFTPRWVCAKCKNKL